MPAPCGAGCKRTRSGEAALSPTSEDRSSYLCIPPSTKSSTPVMLLLSPEARKTTAGCNLFWCSCATKGRSGQRYAIAICRSRAGRKKPRTSGAPRPSAGPSRGFPPSVMTQSPKIQLACWRSAGRRPPSVHLQPPAAASAVPAGWPRTREDVASAAEHRGPADRTVDFGVCRDDLQRRW
jgi:hypothetical protein